MSTRTVQEVFDSGMPGYVAGKTLLFDDDGYAYLKLNEKVTNRPPRKNAVEVYRSDTTANSLGIVVKDERSLRKFFRNKTQVIHGLLPVQFIGLGGLETVTHLDDRALYTTLAHLTNHQDAEPRAWWMKALFNETRDDAAATKLEFAETEVRSAFMPGMVPVRVNPELHGWQPNNLQVALGGTWVTLYSYALSNT